MKRAARPPRLCRSARSALAALAALAMIALGGCGRDDGRVTLRMWAMGREGELVQELTREFERAHPGVRVDVQQVPWSAAHEKVLTAFVGESTPDVAQMGNTWMAELATLGALRPLDEEVARSAAASPVDGVVAADYFPGIWAGNQVGGVLYGVPWYVDTRLLFYRQDLLAEAGFPAVPTTWPEWLRAMEAIKQRVGPARYSILLPVNEFEQLLTMVLSVGEPVLRDGDRYGNFRGDGFRRALTFYLELFRRQLAPVATETTVTNVWEELDRGYYSFFFHGPWSINEFKRRLPAARQGVWMTAAMPGPQGPGAGIAGGSSLVVFRGSRHPVEAWQLVEFLSRPSSQRRFYALTSNLPSRRSSWADAALAQDRHIAAFRDQLERVRSAPPVPEWERILTEMRLVSERAVHRVGPRTSDAELARVVDAAAAELDVRVDELLEKRRWMLARKERR